MKDSMEWKEDDGRWKETVCLLCEAACDLMTTPETSRYQSYYHYLSY